MVGVIVLSSPDAAHLPSSDGARRPCPRLMAGSRSMGAPREPDPGLWQPRGGDHPGCGIGPIHSGAITRWSRSAGRGDATVGSPADRAVDPVGGRRRFRSSVGGRTSVRPATNGFSLGRRRTAEFEVPIGRPCRCGAPGAARRRGSINRTDEELPVAAGPPRRGKDSATAPFRTAPRRRCALSMAVGRDSLPGGVDGGGRLPGGRITAGSDLAGCAGRRRSTAGRRRGAESRARDPAAEAAVSSAAGVSGAAVIGAGALPAGPDFVATGAGTWHTVPGSDPGPGDRG